VYAGVSSHEQRSGLDRQVACLSERATEKGMAVGEVGPGAGRYGRKLARRTAVERTFSRLLAGPTSPTVVGEHQDRRARFGVRAG
jgi:putative resolvase